MILKLRNETITVEANEIPLNTSSTFITYDYELGTNHYDTVLTVCDRVYKGKNPEVNLDCNYPFIGIKVELFDTNERLMRVYTGIFSYIKLCLIGTSELIDVYKQLEILYNENIKLKEQGEVI